VDGSMLFEHDFGAVLTRAIARGRAAPVEGR